MGAAGATPAVPTVEGMSFRIRSPESPTVPRGFTLVEALVVLVLVAILALLAWPPLQALVDRWRLDAAATALAGDLQFARFEAVVRNEPVRLSVLPDGAAGACYLVHTGPASACSCQGRCSGEAAWLRQVDLPAHRRLTLRAPATSLHFDPQLGTCTPAGTFQFTSASGAAVHQIVSVMGRVRSCSPGGTVAGHAAC